MAKKFEKSGNYLVVTDTVTGIREVESPTLELYYRDNQETIRFYHRSQQRLVGKQVGYPFGITAAAGSVSLDTGESTKADGTITCATVVGAERSDGTITCATVVGRDTAITLVTFATALAGVSAVGSITVASPSADNAPAFGTVTCASVIADDTVTVNGLLYTAVAGAKSDNTEFSVDTGDTECATDLADSITNDTRAGTLHDVTASNVAGLVTMTQTAAGSGGDATTLVSSDGGTLAVSGATFSGGSDSADTVTINGLVYTAVNGVKYDNSEFSTTNSAVDLEQSINADTRVGTLGDVTATETGGVITLTQTILGAGGDATTSVENTSATRLVVGGATFASGVDADTVTINGLLYTAVAGLKTSYSEFSIDTSDIATGADFTDTIGKDPRNYELDYVSAVDEGDGTVTLSSSILGAGGNATASVENTGASTITVTGATFAGGVDGDTATVNGLLYTAVVGAKADFTEFSVDTSDDACATDLADSIDVDFRAGTLNDVTASATTDTVTIVQTVRGVGGDATTLVSSDGGTLAVSGAVFSGGADGDTVTVNGLLYTAVVGAKDDDTQFSVDTSDTATATDLADSIDDDVRVGTLNDLTAVGAVAVVTATTTVGGTVGNATTLVSSDGGTLAVSGAVFTGGLDDALVSSITVDSIEVMSGTEVFDTDIDTTASNIAANITAHTSVPNYTATASGDTITITADVKGTGGNGLVVVTTEAVFTTTDTNLAGAGADIVDSGDAAFATHAALITFLEANTGA